MDYLIFLLYRACTLAVGALPLGLAFRLGQTLGWVAWVALFPYRRLAQANLTIALGDRLDPGGVRRLTRQHFQTLGANFLCSIRATTFDAARLREVAEVEGMENIQGAFAVGRGVVLAISHIGNWELFAQLCQFLPDEKWGTIYQPLGNRYIEAHIRRMRQKVTLFSRKSGFNAPTAFLRANGAVGVLIDQHAGDGGVWTPFFGRLASTSTLAALLALRTDALIVPMAVYTAGVARWRVVISPPVSTMEPTGRPLGADALTSRLNDTLERQIARSPADWFWVHNRWKTPRPKFLLATYRRGIILPPGMPAAELKPFRLLVRSPNWLGDAVMSIPAVQMIAAGRPDARVTVLAPGRLADLWRAVPGVAEVLPIERERSVFSVAAAVRKAGPFDAAVLLPNSLRVALEVWLARIPRRVGFPGHRRRWLLNQVVYEEPRLPKHLRVADAAAASGQAAEAPSRTVREKERTHQSRRYVRLASEVGAGDAPEFGASTGAAPAAAIETAPMPGRGGWLRIGICPGAEYGPTKRWPAERFAEAARLISSRRACEWVLFGVERDAEIGAIIEKVLAGHCENLIRRTSLAELIGQLRQCHALLTNDTGTMHLAAWLGVPVVAIFGSTDPILTGPMAPPARVRILRRQVECSPCFLAECPIDLRCLKAIEAEDAAAAVLELVGSV